MTDSENTQTVGILGAGTMGAGIAQVAAQHGWTVELMDVDVETVRNAIAQIHSRFDRLVEKHRMTADEALAAKKRLLIATSPQCMQSCSLIIEAIVEDLDIKSQVLAKLLPHVDSHCIIASNTSSLSITRLGEAIKQPLRIVGMHFFNPAPLMKLVEVIAGQQTDPAVVDRVAAIAESWEKVVARAADVPGFIVNHVARPYYLEAFRLLEDQIISISDPQLIDRTMTSLGNFRMGPFELTDLIGQDVNTATTRSVWEQLDHPPLLHPSALQESLVRGGYLGRKTGRGVFDYQTDPPAPALDIHASNPLASKDILQVCQSFAAAAVDERAEHATEIDERSAYILSRILAALIVQAHLAEQRGVATRDDIDTALKFGVNYPRGPFAWTAAIGTDITTELLAALNETVDDDRFALPQNLLTASASSR